MSAAALLCLGAVACSDVKYEDAPYVTPASNVTASVQGRKVTLRWSLPGGDIDKVIVMRNADYPAAITLPANATSYTFRTQPMGEPQLYTVKVLFKDGKMSEGQSVEVTVPVLDVKVTYLLTAANPGALPDDDEQAAAQWFQDNYVATGKGKFITPEEIATLDPDYYPVIWIENDRVGQPMGWQNMPAEIVGCVDDLKAYSENGGSLFLSNMATQLTVPCGIVPENMAPTVYGNGGGGIGTDVWVINPQLGWDFRPEGDRPGADGQGYYDRSAHAIYKGITLEDPNGYGYPSIPLIGPGNREDHNCLWDCNIYGKGSEADVIANFEKTTNSLVLATWGHVRDHCVAAFVEFYATANHGRCIAMGAAAYEWHQNSNTNIYQNNIDILTRNCLEYLK